MEKHYQKEVNIGKMIKTLAKRWTAIILATLIALVAGAAVGFLTTFTNKVYGVDLDFYFYQIPNTDKDGNTIIGTATEYDESTMNMIFQTINSQSFTEAIFCENGIPDAEGETDEKMLDAIKNAEDKVSMLNEARKELANASLGLTMAKKATIAAKSTFDTEKADYDAARQEYSNAVQANATALGSNNSTAVVSPEEMAILSNSVSEQKVKYNEAKVAYDTAIKAEQSAENKNDLCKQAIIDLSKEVREAKNDAMSLKRKQESFKGEVKKASKSIKVSYADEKGVNKSTIRVSIAVDKEIENSEEFAKRLADLVRDQLPTFVVEKVDYSTANCELTNVLDEVEHINKKEIIVNTLTFGLIGGFLAGLIVCVVVALKNKEEYMVLVPYDTVE